MSEDIREIEERLREVEKSHAVHEGVCAERYKNILEGQSNLKALALMANGLLMMIIGAIAAGSPVVVFLQRLLGG